MKRQADKYDRLAEWLRSEASEDVKRAVFLIQRAAIKQSQTRIIHFPASAGMK